jgi:hypothetical protein
MYKLGLEGEQTTSTCWCLVPESRCPTTTGVLGSVVMAGSVLL